MFITLTSSSARRAGEEVADYPLESHSGAVGLDLQIQNLLKDKAEIVGTIICGDGYSNENVEKVCDGIREVLKSVKLDLLVAGPAFNAGRYGMACGQGCQGGV